MRVRKVRLDSDRNFVDQIDTDNPPHIIAQALSTVGVSLVTITFDDGRETLWSKIVEMKKSRPMPTVPFTGKY